jgi:hypothetical protein
MASDAFDRIILELQSHPKERIGFRREDFDTLSGEERAQTLNMFFAEVEEGWGYSGQLEWLLGDEYVSTLKGRLASLPPRAHGRLFLPYFIYLKTREMQFALKMMSEIIDADPTWERRERAIGGYLLELIGTEPVFFDFCRYIILNVSGYWMKRGAMLWLAYQKGVIAELYLPEQLEACVRALDRSSGCDQAARIVLNAVHADTGSFVV